MRFPVCERCGERRAENLRTGEVAECTCLEGDKAEAKELFEAAKLIAVKVCHAVQGQEIGSLLLALGMVAKAVGEQKKLDDSTVLRMINAGLQGTELGPEAPRP